MAYKLKDNRFELNYQRNWINAHHNRRSHTPQGTGSLSVALFWVFVGICVFAFCL